MIRDYPLSTCGKSSEKLNIFTLLKVDVRDRCVYEQNGWSLKYFLVAALFMKQKKSFSFNLSLKKLINVTSLTL